jgi:hypothetical protein
MLRRLVGQAQYVANLVSNEVGRATFASVDSLVKDDQEKFVVAIADVFSISS